MYGWGGDGPGVAGWIVMAVLMILFWGGVVTVVVVLLRRPHSEHAGTDMRASHHGAEQILNERFARGEIDDTEYLARRGALRRPE